MTLDEFDFVLPEGAIAQQPLEDRAASRMLVVHRGEGRWEDRTFRDLPSDLRPGDCLVLNDSKVIPARLFGHRAGVRSLPIGKKNPTRHEYLTGKVEVLLERALTPDQLTWRVLARPGRKLHIGERITFSDDLEAEILARGEFGERTLRFHARGDFYEALERAGHVPLPPYIHREDTPQDRRWYQTVFARERGSAAAPTAGLHFTPEVLEACRAAGSGIAKVTLHVGLGTFQPIHAAEIEQAKLHSERYAISPETARQIREARRVIAVGTTAVRTVETAAAREWRELQGETDLFVRPGFVFRRVDAMLTNFHLPQSSLLILVCAFGGRELILEAYRHAVASGYRFYSYGDCMLIL
jgi:S-adenosylmethionine:tRNA ribosyltransferase-isomerase